MPPDISCIFCEIITKRALADVIFEDERNTVVLPLEQELFGHALIIPKPHYETLLDIQPAELKSLMTFVQLVAKLYKERLGSGDFNLLAANGIAAQQSVPHFHFHYFPRFAGDCLNTWPQLPGPANYRRADFLTLVQKARG